MVRPTQRRAVVQWSMDAYRVPARRACRIAGVTRAMVRYRSVRATEKPLKKRLKELAAVRVRAGYRQLHVSPTREGWTINHKRTYQLYTEEGLACFEAVPAPTASERRRAL